MTEPIVQLRRIGVRFGAVPVLVDVDLSIAPGEIVGVAGPNGSGKTTLLGVVATLIRPSSGTGSVLGAALGTDEVRRIRPRIGLSGHEPAVYPELSLVENLRFVARIAGVPTDTADRVLADVGLAAAADRPAGRSSHGMQRRIDLARMLMLEPDLVLLDEAHAGLDKDAEIIIDAILQRVRARGGGGLLVSHDAGRLARQVDRVLRIEAGATV